MKINISYTTQVLFLCVLFFNGTRTSAKNLEVGQKVFLANCNVCHERGNNIIIPEKNLKKETLEANGMNNVPSIIYQVTNGKNGMPAFGGRLTKSQIEGVANYVLLQSEKTF